MSDTDCYWVDSPLPWQGDAYRQLLARYRDGSLPHALLLGGTAGIGKRHLAGLLAARVLCRADGEFPCGVCASCAVVRGGGHGDYRWLRVEEGKQAIAIDQVRRAVAFMQQTAGYGEFKVLVIAPVEAMTTAAANALLKTLEEPPGRSLLILVSDRIGSVLPTVRSRCQKLVLEPPGRGAARDWLMASGYPGEFAEDALDLEAGSPLPAARLLDDGQLEPRRATRDALSAVLEGRVTPAGALEDLADVTPDALLTQLIVLLQERLRTADRAALRSWGRRGLQAEAQLVGLQGVVRSGSNPARDIAALEALRLGYGAVAGHAGD